MPPCPRRCWAKRLRGVDPARGCAGAANGRTAVASDRGGHMSDNIAITGVVGTDPHHHVTGQGLPITSFRLASTQRYFDRAKGSWEDGETNWYTVSAFRQLASNA